jgi:RNA-directed DNA polymerase
MSGVLWERKRQRLYFLHRWPARSAMKQVRARVWELTPRRRCHEDIPAVIAEVNPVLRGWSDYFRTGNAAKKFNQIDAYVWRRLWDLRVKRKGRSLKPGEAATWTQAYFWNLGLHSLRGTVQYPERPFFWATA